MFSKNGAFRRGMQLRWPRMYINLAHLQVLMWLDEARCLVLSTRFSLEIPLFG